MPVPVTWHVTGKAKVKAAQPDEQPPVKQEKGLPIVEGLDHDFCWSRQSIHRRIIRSSTP